MTILPQRCSSTLSRVWLSTFVMLLTIACALLQAGDAASRVNTMPEDEFWALIGRTVSKEADPEAQLDQLRTELRALPPDRIEAFEATFWQQMNRAYTWDLWGAAYVVHGGASDDGFEYFRRWLISKGRGVFERVVAKPDDLAGLLVEDVEGVLEFEDFAWVAGEVWSESTGRSIDEFQAMPGAMLPGAEPAGTPFEEDAGYLASKYPKLWARFGENPLQ